MTHLQIDGIDFSLKKTSTCSRFFMGRRIWRAQIFQPIETTKASHFCEPLHPLSTAKLHAVQRQFHCVGTTNCLSFARVRAEG